jgi:hypothetical protein
VGERVEAYLSGGKGTRRYWDKGKVHDGHTTDCCSVVDLPNRKETGQESCLCDNKRREV